MHSSVSSECSLPKHEAAKPTKQRIALEPSQSVHADPISVDAEANGIG